MDFSRTGIEIGPFDIFGTTIHPTLHFYGLLVVTGIVAGAYLVAWMAKKDGKDPEHVWNGLIWAVVAGIIGARLWHVLFLPKTSIAAGKDTMWMFENFFNLQEGPLAIWNGGLGIYGGALGGLVGCLLYARRHKLKDIWEWIDMAAIALPLGHGIGRWGNYVNQELYGKPTDLPWGIKIDNPIAPYTDADRFHPLYFYEFVWNWLLCGVLLYVWWRYRKQLIPGDFVLFYILGYAPMRFLLEFLRVETAELPGININSSQIFSAGVTLFAAALLFYRHKWRNRTVTHSDYREDGRPVGKSHKEKYKHAKDTK